MVKQTVKQLEQDFLEGMQEKSSQPQEYAEPSPSNISKLPVTMVSEFHAGISSCDCGCQGEPCDHGDHSCSGCRKH